MSDQHALLAHQFDDLTQQHEASSLGMWLFLATEIMFFGGLFTGYTVYRHANPVAFGAASKRLDILLGGINTLVLIASSFTMAMAVHSAQERRRKPLMVFLALTMLLGSVFLGIKYVEYHHKFEEHLVPGHNFSFPDPHRRGAELFFSFYFAMTGMHALHMVVGIGLMTVLLIGARSGRFTSGNYNTVEAGGLYWHFVDIVWIFLFPLLYLIERHV